MNEFALVLECYYVIFSWQTANVDMYLRQIWVDPRLVYDREESGVSSLLLNDGEWDIIWVPDIFFENALSVTRVGRHRSLILAPNGGVLYIQR